MSFFSAIVPKASTRRPVLRTIAVVAVCAALPPATLASIVSAAAGTLLEATPLFLITGAAASLVPGRVARWLGALGGCGCGPLPGALSLPATALCWLAFGPEAAVLRWLGGVAAAHLKPETAGHRRAPPPSDLRQVDSVGKLAGLAALLAAAAPLVEGAVPGYVHGPAPSFLAGVAAGIVAPCTSGAVAFAASVRITSPALAAGILCSAGFWSIRFARATTAGPLSHERSIDARVVYAAIASAGMLVALRGGATLVHPRLVPLVALGALVALGRIACGPARAPRGALLAALLMLGGAVLNTSHAQLDGSATDLEKAWPGQRFRFIGEVAGERGADRAHTTLVRSAITCCRADAAPVALRLDRRLAQPAGTWAAVEGTIAQDARGIFLRVQHQQCADPPADPFLYR